MKKKSLKTKAAAHDLFAEVNQTACDKLLNSGDYPLTVFEKKQEFPGCSRMAADDEGSFYEYSKPEIKRMLAESLQLVKSGKARSLTTLQSELYSFAGSIIEQAKKLIDAANEAGSDYEGP